jgi:hypothetical protein
MPGDLYSSLHHLFGVIQIVIDQPVVRVRVKVSPYVMLCLFCYASVVHGPCFSEKVPKAKVQVNEYIPFRKSPPRRPTPPFSRVLSPLAAQPPLTQQPISSQPPIPGLPDHKASA